MTRAVDPTTGKDYSPVSGDAVNDHDPFDPFRRNQVDNEERRMTPLVEAYGTLKPFVEALRGLVVNGKPTRPSNRLVGFRLVPLIYSPGPDGEADLVLAKDIVMTEDVSLNPYFPTNEDDNYSMGAPYLADGEDLTTDNIHNHLLGLR